MGKIKLILGASLLLLVSVPAGAALLYDNGFPIEEDMGMRYNFGQYTIYEDFALTERSVITGLGWSQYDEDLDYIGTTLSFFQTLDTAPLITFDVVASRVGNGLNGVPFSGKVDGPVTGYDYFAFLGFYLNPGTYWVGINNEVTGGRTLTANTLGTTQTIPNSYQGISPDNLEFVNHDHAFQIFGDVASFHEPPSPVHVPAAIWLFGTGLIGLIGFSKRRKAK